MDKFVFDLFLPFDLAALFAEKIYNITDNYFRPLTHPSCQHSYNFGLT